MAVSDDIRKTIDDLADQGKKYLKSKEVVRAVGWDDTFGNRSKMGHRLRELEQEGVLEPWGDSTQGGRTYVIIGTAYEPDRADGAEDAPDSFATNGAGGADP